MLSDNDKKLIKDIKSSLESIEANLDNLSFVYKTAGNLFRLSDRLEDKNLRSSLKGECAKIMQTQYKEEIQQAVKSIFSFINTTEKLQPQTKRYFEGPTPIKTEEYNKDCEKYYNLKDEIKNVEDKIMNSPVYQKKLHEPLKENKTWPNHLHARLTDNLRIVYFYNKKTREITFKRVVTHNEIDKS